MNKRLILTELGGFPLTQDALAFMQESYRGAFGAIATLCGSKTILHGVQVVAGNVTPGWIAFNGELIPFLGGAVAADVVITDTAAVLPEIFADGSSKNIYFTKVATVGAAGDFPFAQLVPLLALQNIWRPGDIKERYCNNAYIAANFDADGFGINAEIGWRILTKAYPDAAGKVMAAINPADATLDEAGKTVGSPTHFLTTNEIPSHTHEFLKIQTNGNGGTSGYVLGASTGWSSKTTEATGGGAAHNNMQPTMAILKLIKL